MLFALENGETIPVNVDASLKECIPVVREVLRRDCCSYVFASTKHELNGVSRRDMLHDDAKLSVADASFSDHD